MKNEMQGANGVLVDGPPITSDVLRHFADVLVAMAGLIDLDSDGANTLVLSGFAIATSGGLTPSTARMAPGEVILSVRLDTRTNHYGHNPHG